MRSRGGRQRAVTRERKSGCALQRDSDELARASSREQADQILKRAHSRVSVTVSQS